MSIVSAIWIAHVWIMAKSAQAETYRRVRRWLDRDLAANSSYSIAVWGPTSAAGFAFIGAYNAGAIEPLAVFLFWVLVVPPWAASMTFVIWRASRLLRVEVIKGDRDYDQRGKYLLPPEYARSESVAAANRRERRRKRIGMDRWRTP